MFFILKYEYDKLYTYIKIILNRKRKIIRKRKLTLNDREKKLKMTGISRFHEIRIDHFFEISNDITKYSNYIVNLQR